MRMKNEGRICALDGCERPAVKRHYCETHYQRLRAHGDATIVRRVGNNVPFDWLEAHKGYTGKECLAWPFTRSTDGRGQITIKGKNRKAPRVMCELAHGAPPTPKHQAAHSCGKGHEGCINPGHLVWKTRKENEADKLIHGTRPLGEDAPTAKITEEQAREIRRRAQSETCNSLAREFGLHPGTVSQIKRGLRWKHLWSDMADDAEPFATAIINQARAERRQR